MLVVGFRGRQVAQSRWWKVRGGWGGEGGAWRGGHGVSGAAWHVGWEGRVAGRNVSCEEGGERRDSGEPTRDSPVRGDGVGERVVGRRGGWEEGRSLEAVVGRIYGAKRERGELARQGGRGGSDAGALGDSGEDEGEWGSAGVGAG
ncbi:hypothetical protein Tco_0835183 [Tanacetum coccineum]